MNNKTVKRMLFTLLCLTTFNTKSTQCLGANNRTPDLSGVNHLELLHDVSLRIFIEDLLCMYWEISDLPTEMIPPMLNILAAYSEEPEYALQVVQDNFPDLNKKESEFYQNYQIARKAKFDTFSRSILTYIKGDVIADIGGEDTRLVDTLISMRPSIEKAYVTDINMIKGRPKNPKVEFVWQPKPQITPLSDKSVDSVIMSTMLHHIDTPIRMKLLTHVSDILRDGGRIILVEDSFPESKSFDDAITSLDERFLSFSNENKLEILSFLDWWGNRLMKNSREIPLPCTFKSMENWEVLLKELGLDLVEKKYLGIPEMHTHIMAPKAILVFEKSKVPHVQKAGFNAKDRCVKSIVRADSNREMMAFVPEKDVHVNLSIGGSKIQTAVVNSDTEELFRLKEYSWRKHMIDEPKWNTFSSTEKRDWLVERIMDQISIAVQKLKEDYKVNFQVEGVGIAWAGPVKPDGLIIGPNIDGFKFQDLSNDEREKGGINLADSIQEQMNRRFYKRDWRVYFLNDGDAAAISNFKKAKLDNGLLLTIGTGIGSGLVKNGEVLYSIDGFKDRIGEIGHHILYHPQQNRYFYYGVLTRGKILEHTIPYCISERLAGPGLARRFISRLQREMGHDQTKIHRYLNSCSETADISFSEIELAACDENAEIGPMVEKKILKLITFKASQSEMSAISYVRESGYELGLGIGVFIKEFERESYVKNIILSGSVGKSFGKGLIDNSGDDLFLSQILKGIDWSMRNHFAEMNPQFMISMDPSFAITKSSKEEKETSTVVLIKG